MSVIVEGAKDGVESLIYAWLAGPRLPVRGSLHGCCLREKPQDQLAEIGGAIRGAVDSHRKFPVVAVRFCRLDSWIRLHSATEFELGVKLRFSRFQHEIDELMGSGDAQALEQAVKIIRDRWLDASEHYELVAAIIGNWTSGNCIPYMLPVSRRLLESGDLYLHHQLWARSIKRQVSTFFREYSHLRKLRLSFDDLVSTESSGFDEFNWQSYSDKRVAASFLLNRLIADLHTWEAELDHFGMDTHEVESIVSSLKLLKQPKIEINRLTPNNSKTDSYATT